VCLDRKVRCAGKTEKKAILSRQSEEYCVKMSRSLVVRYSVLPYLTIHAESGTPKDP
jgi:hypothetical protein